MEVMVSLSDEEVKYIRNFKRELTQNPMKDKALKIPSVQIFLKVAEEVQ